MLLKQHHHMCCPKNLDLVSLLVRLDFLILAVDCTIRDFKVGYHTDCSLTVGIFAHCLRRNEWRIAFIGDASFLFGPVNCSSVNFSRDLA